MLMVIWQNPNQPDQPRSDENDASQNLNFDIFYIVLYIFYIIR